MQNKTITYTNQDMRDAAQLLRDLKAALVEPETPNTLHKDASGAQARHNKKGA